MGTTMCRDFHNNDDQLVFERCVSWQQGTIPGSETRFTLDKDHVFEVGKPYTVCGNTAAMCGEGGVSWLSKHFEVMGNRDVHFGLFAACSTPAASDAPKEGSVIGGGCC